MPDRLPDAEALRERARELVPLLQKNAALATELRRLPEENIEAFHDAGLFGWVRPAAYGGSEGDPARIYEVQRILGEACASSAWVFGVLSVHTWQLALFDAQAQEDVWGASERALIASSYMPVGKVTRVEGGIRVSGRWSFSSGCDHCAWFMLGAFVPRADGEGQDMTTLLIPREDVEIIDTWHVTGLSGSGSKDVVVEDAFVPSHRLHAFSDGFMQDSPGNAVNASHHYRYPFGQIHVRCVSSPALGAATRAIQVFREGLPMLKAEWGEDREVLLRAALTAIARCTSLVDREVLALDRDFGDMVQHLAGAEKIDMIERVRNRYDAARAVEVSWLVVSTLFTLAGRSANRVDHPLNRIFQDVRAIRQHHANGMEGPSTNFGRVIDGGRTADFFV